MGYLMIFDIAKSKLIGSIQPAGKNSSFKVDWNSIDPNFLLMSSQSGKSFVVYCQPMDPQDKA